MSCSLLLQQGTVGKAGRGELARVGKRGFVDLPYADGYEVKELWTGHEAQVQDALSGYVPKHGVKLFRVKAAE